MKPHSASKGKKPGKIRSKNTSSETLAKTKKKAEKKNLKTWKGESKFLFFWFSLSENYYKIEISCRKAGRVLRDRELEWRDKSYFDQKDETNLLSCYICNKYQKGAKKRKRSEQGFSSV